MIPLLKSSIFIIQLSVFTLSSFPPDRICFVQHCRSLRNCRKLFTVSIGATRLPTIQPNRSGVAFNEKINIFRTCIKIELSSLFVCKWQCEIRANMPRIIHARAPEKNNFPSKMELFATMFIDTN